MILQRRANSFREIESDKLVRTDAIQSAGNQTFYRRGKTWIAENAKDVDIEKDKNVQKIKQFSDEKASSLKEQTVAGIKASKRLPPGLKTALLAKLDPIQFSDEGESRAGHPGSNRERNSIR